MVCQSLVDVPPDIGRVGVSIELFSPGLQLFQIFESDIGTRKESDYCPYLKLAKRP
jgi:hypothetical protein